MEEQVIQFVEEISGTRIMTSSEMLDMKTTLLDEMKRSVTPQNSSMFLKALKEKMEASDSNIFTENGLNVEAVKSLVTSVAKDVEKKNEINIENEQKNFAENKKLMDDMINDFTEEENVNKEVEQDEEIDLSEMFGYTFKVSKEELKDAEQAAKAFDPNATKKDAMKLIEEKDIYDEINELMKNEGMTYDEALTIALTNRNIGLDSEKANEIEREGKFKVFSLIVAEAMVEMANGVSKSNDGSEFFNFDFDLDTFTDLLKKEHPEFSDIPNEMIRSVVERARKEQIPYENNHDNDGQQGKNDGQEDNSTQTKQDEQENSKRTRKRFKITQPILGLAATIYNGFRELGENTPESEVEKESSFRKDYDNLRNELIDIRKLGTSSRKYVNIRNGIEAAREFYIKQARTVQATIAVQNGSNVEFDKINNNREIILENIVERFFEEGDKHLTDFYSEIDIEVLDKNQILFSDITKALQKRITENPYYTNISNNLIRVESIINLKTREINALKELKAAMEAQIKNGALYGDSISELAKIEEKIANLTSDLESAKIDSQRDKDVFKNYALYTNKHQEYKAREAADYIGLVEELKKPKMLDDEYVDLKNSFIRDRNTIKKESVKKGISEFEAAKMYFETKPECLKKYSKQFKGFFDGKNNGENFNIDIMDDIIKFHNTQVKEALSENITTDLNKYEEIIENAIHPEELISRKKIIAESRAQYIKAVNLEEYFSKDKTQRSTERDEHLNKAVEKYFSSNKSVGEIVAELSETDGIRDIDTNEVLKRVTKKVEEQNPGAGKQLFELEMQIEELEMNKEVHMDLLDKSKFAHIYKKAWNAEIDNVNRSMENKRKEIDGIKGKYLEQNAKNTDAKEEQEEYGAIEEGNRLRKMSSIDISKVLTKNSITSQELAEQIGIIVDAGRDGQETIKDEQVDRSF